VPDEHDTNTHQNEEEAIKLCFDGCKHMSTLSAAGAALLVTVYRGDLIESGPLIQGFIGLLLSISISLAGLLVPIRSFSIGANRHRWLAPFAWLYFSVLTFAIGVLLVAMEAIKVPFVLSLVVGWTVSSALGFFGMALLLRRPRR
jgi:hypothetical protein